VEEEEEELWELLGPNDAPLSAARDVIATGENALEKSVNKMLQKKCAT